MNKVFDNEVYEQQRKNIEALAAKNPDDWFYKSQMERPANRRTGFAPVDRPGVIDAAKILQRAKKESRLKS